MSSPPPTVVVIDASLRFARSNPELVRYAEASAGAGGSVDQLLRDAIDRVIATRAKQAPMGAGARRPRPLAVLRSTG